MKQLMPSDVAEEKDAVPGVDVNVETETRQAHGAKNPFKPSAKDIAEHNLTHMNYRDWCPTCVAARGTSQPHFSGVDRTDRDVPAVSSDYCFMCRDPKEEEAAAKEEEAVNTEEELNVKTEKLVILNVKDSQTGCLRPHLVPRKGVSAVP